MKTAIDSPVLDALVAAHPHVDEVAALVRGDAGDAELVLYAVPRGPLDPGELAARARQGGINGNLPIVVVPVAALPLDSEGRVDAEALRRIPVVDEESIARWEGRLQEVAGVRRAAVTPRAGGGPRALLHVEEILPAGELRDRAAPDEDVREGGAHREDAARSAGAPALSEGGPLPRRQDRPRTLLDTLARAAEGPRDLGVRYVHRDLSDSLQPYGELRSQAERVLGGLRARGFGPGSRAIFQFRENRDFLTAFWGCVFAGVIPAPVAVAPTFDAANAASEKLMAAWRMLGRPSVLTTADLAPTLRDFASRHGLEGFQVQVLEDLLASDPDGDWHPSRAEDVALIMLTSGSTGTPKGVKLTHGNLVARSVGSEAVNGFTRDEVTLSWMPLDHVAALLFFHLRDVHLGCRQIHCPTDVILGDPLRWLDLLDRYRCTVTFAPNFAFGLVNDRAGEMRGRHWDLSCVNAVLNGAESIVARTARRFMSLLEPHGLPHTAMVPAWGMSEVSSGVTYSRAFSLETVRDADSFVSVGRPIPGVSLRIVDDEGRVLPEGVTGNLEARGDTLMAGYYDESLDAEVFTDDGWFRTGDLAFLADGALTITGRAKDVIIVNSVNYYSHEIEAAVEEVAGVTRSFSAACAVREAGGDTDRLAVFLHTERQGDPLVELVRSVRQSCLRRVGVAPDYVLPVARSDIPKTEIGKIQRPLLAKRFTAGDFDDVRRRMDLLLGNERTVPDWFFRKSWRRKDGGAPSGGPGQGTWVVFTDRRDLGDAVARALAERGIPWVAVEAGVRFERRGPDRWLIAPGSPGHYRRLLDDLEASGHSVARTLHLWTWGEPGPGGPDGGSFPASCAPGVFSLLHWIRALGGKGAHRPDVRIVVASSASQAVASGDAVVPERAALLGLVSSAPEELPWLDCRHVDLPAGDPERVAAALLAEADRPGSDRQIAYRDGRRYVAGLERVRFDGAGRGIALERGGFYLVTGGLGGLGLELARHLLERFDAKVLLVDRAEAPNADPAKGPPPDAPAEGSDTLGWLRETAAAVRIVSMDATDAEALRGAVSRAEEEWGAPLAGVFHLAGRYEERALLEETADSLEESLRPKLQGARALAPLLDERPQAFLVGFSTAITFFGGSTVAAYAAASCALEGFLLERGRRAPGRTLCTSWSTWRDVGISRAFAGNAAVLRSKGYEAVGVREGLTSLLACLRLNGGQVYVGLDGTSPNVRRHLQEEPWALHAPTALYTTDTDDPGEVGSVLAAITLADAFGTAVPYTLTWVDALPLDASGAVDRVALATPGRLRRSDRVMKVPKSDMERLIARVWSEALGCELLDVRENFFDLGGNSLLMAQVRSSLSATLHREVSLTELFQYPTVDALAAHLSHATATPSLDLGASQALGEERRRRLQAVRRSGRTR